MGNLEQFVEWRRPDTLRGGIRRDELGMSLFQFDQFSKKKIVLGVGNPWAILDVVEIVVPSDFVPEGNQFGKNIGVGHRTGWR